MTAALLRFLNARLAEDQQAARAAMWDEQSDTWTARPPQARYERYIVADYCDDGVVVVIPENADADGVGQHIARHDPARVLAEVDTKRRILALHSDATGHSCSITDETGYELNYAEVAGGEPCTTLRLLALPYADHPDYRPEWAPDPVRPA